MTTSSSKKSPMQQFVPAADWSQAHIVERHGGASLDMRDSGLSESHSSLGGNQRNWASLRHARLLLPFVLLVGLSYAVPLQQMFPIPRQHTHQVQVSR